MNSLFCRLAPAILTSHLCNCDFWNVWNLYRFCHSALPTEIMFDFRIISEHWELASFLLLVEEKKKGLFLNISCQAFEIAAARTSGQDTLVFSRQTGFSSGRCVYCDKPNGSQLNLLYQAQAFGRRLEISKRYPSYMQRLAQLLNKDVARL